MHLSEKDFKNIYKLQDKVLVVLKPVINPFYLTGGTALGRFYLYHRYSEDLDFFCPQTHEFTRFRNRIMKALRSHFSVDTDRSVFSEDFSRIWIGEPVTFKIELVNDVPYKAVEPLEADGLLVDHPVDIQANKLSAILNREEPKDIIDIKTIAEYYAFNWSDMFHHAKSKALIDEVDVAVKLASFPLQWLKAVVFTGPPETPEHFSRTMEILVNDFLSGNDNSIGASKPEIYTAKPQSKRFIE